MNVVDYYILNNRLLISFSYLHNYGIPTSRTEKWVERNREGIYKFVNGAYIEYDKIPEVTKSEIPQRDLFILWIHDNQKLNLKTALEDSKNTFTKYIEKYRHLNNQDSKAVDFAKKHAIISRIIFALENKEYSLQMLREAYNSIFPQDNYSYHYFSGFLSKARKYSIENVICHGNIGKKNAQKFNAIHQKLVLETKICYHTASSRKIHEVVNSILTKNGVLNIGLTSVKCILKEYENTLFDTLKGEVEGRKRKAYIPMENVPFADNQWQMDGWKLPFYYKDGNRLLRLWLIAVIDSHSRKIVGYHIDTSERLTSILKALDNALKETQSCAFELVADNHSSQATKELQDFQSELKKLGVTFTTDSNPRRKATLERLFQTIDNDYFRYEPGWVGEGVKTRRHTGRQKPEVLEKYVNKPLTKEQIVQITVRIVETYNSTVKKSLKDQSPNSAYSSSERPYSIPVDDLSRIRITNKPQHYKVSRGIITVSRGITKKHFGYLENWEGKTLEVFTANDFETIYAIDPKTGEIIVEDLPALRKMHPDLASRNEGDKKQKIDYMHHMKSVKGKKDSSLKELAKKANSEMELLGIPSEMFNPLSHKKNQHLETDLQYRINQKISEEYDINPDMIEEPEYKRDSVLERALVLINVQDKPKKKEYHLPGSGKLINPNDYYKD